MRYFYSIIYLCLILQLSGCIQETLAVIEQEQSLPKQQMGQQIREIENQEELANFHASDLYYNEHNLFDYYLNTATPAFSETIAEHVNFNPSDWEVHYFGYSKASDLFLLGFYLSDENGETYGGYKTFSLNPASDQADSYYYTPGTGFYNKEIWAHAKENYPDLLDIILD